MHGTSPGKFRISNRGLLTCWLKEAAGGLLAEGRRWFYFSGWRCGSQGKVRWESSPSLILHFPRCCCECSWQLFLLQAGQAWVLLQTHQHQPQCPTSRAHCPPPRESPLGAARSREGVSWPQLSSGAALSPVPAAIPWLQTLLDHSCWDGLSAQSQRKGDSHAMLGSREIRNKPKPSRKRGLCLCVSQKELGGLGSPSSWLITASQIFN